MFEEMCLETWFGLRWVPEPKGLTHALYVYVCAALAFAFSISLFVLL